MYALDVEYSPITTPALIGLETLARSLALMYLPITQERATSATKSEA